MLTKARISLASAALMLVFVAPAFAKLPADQVARLGMDLTPMGAERAGNADGNDSGLDRWHQISGRRGLP